MDNVLLNKASSVERCINRIKEEYSDFETLKNNQTKQDAIILNLQRAIETTIDMGARIIRIKHLGLPQNSREIFSILSEKYFISEELSKRMQKMVGFRNIAIHEYSALNIEILHSIIVEHLSDLSDFSSIVMKIN